MFKIGTDSVLLLNEAYFWYHLYIAGCSKFVEVKVMSRITKEEVKHVANLARLEMDEAEVEKFTTQLDDIISMAEQLNELDTENVEPTTHVLDLKNVLREDKVQPWLTREEALKNAPDEANGQVKVPSIFE